MEGGEGMAVTIRDVAAHCGLSVATVSKVFHGYRDVSRETCERVQRAARGCALHRAVSVRRGKTEEQEEQAWP